jgi:hypothetical protein
MEPSISDIFKWVSCGSSDAPKVSSLLRSHRVSAGEVLDAILSIPRPKKPEHTYGPDQEKMDGFEGKCTEEIEEMAEEKEEKSGAETFVLEYYGRLVDVAHSVLSINPSSFPCSDSVHFVTLLEATRHLDWSGSVVYLWQILLKEYKTTVEDAVLKYVDNVEGVPVGGMNLNGLISLISESKSFLRGLFSEGIENEKEPKRFELIWEVAKSRAKKGISCPTEIISMALMMLTNVQNHAAIGNALHTAGVWVHDIEESLFANAFDAFLAVFRRFLPGINSGSEELEAFLVPLRWFLHQLYNRSAVDLVDRLKREHFEPREKAILSMFMQQLIFHPRLILADAGDAFADEQDEERTQTNYSLVEPPFETALELGESLLDQQADPLRNAWKNVKISIVSKFERDEFVKRMRGYRERINELERQLGLRSPKTRVSDAGDMIGLDEEWMRKINALTTECQSKTDEIIVLRELSSQREKQCKAVEAKLKERNTGCVYLFRPVGSLPSP